MKTIYLYDEKRKLTSVRVVDDTYQLASGETLLEPDRTEYPPYTLNDEGTAWHGLTLEQYQAAHPETKASHNLEQMMIMKQQAQLTQLTEQGKQLQELAMRQQMQIVQLQKKNK